MSSVDTPHMNVEHMQRLAARTYCAVATRLPIHLTNGPPRSLIASRWYLLCKIPSSLTSQLLEVHLTQPDYSTAMFIIKIPCMPSIPPLGVSAQVVAGILFISSRAMTLQLLRTAYMFLIRIAVIWVPTREIAIALTCVRNPENVSCMIVYGQPLPAASS